MAGPIPIKIVEWSDEWPRLFAAETGRILVLTTSLMLHHIGSTSVRGCASKPVIDIMGVVESCDVYAQDQEILVSQLGYESLGEYGVPGRDFLFRYAEANYHISVFAEGDRNIANNLKIRDRLAADESLRNRYVALKRKLARSHPDDYAEYNDRKAVLIAEILAG